MKKLTIGQGDVLEFKSFDITEHKADESGIYPLNRGRWHS